MALTIVLAKRNWNGTDRRNIGDVGWNDKIKEKDNEMDVRVTSMNHLDDVWVKCDP
jgi:hypothetical protein